MTDMLPNGTDICQCAVCKKFFSSTYAFDQHRTGDCGAIVNGVHVHTRRCLTTDEMTARRMGANARGRWTTKPGEIAAVRQRGPQGGQNSPDPRAG